MKAYLSLGSNIGDRRALLREAVSSLRVVQLSPVYETEPVGGPPGQQKYLNIVVEIETDLTPRELLGACHRLEAAADRVRGERWGPRTLDVDILWHESGPVDEPDLILPHPRMQERRFVMAPLADIAPGMVQPDWDDHAEGRVDQVDPL
ncbi:MAG: 2-amino-4-hydroxy-6-hydroxymethyldihydropteridine diphosphokinase [Actinobacteria bacterium]|nr:2-amino-4-hydroxy-6-hydroxymethyldihydropteridine diphosphokinase [Actinomycetota bacterium]